MTESTNELGQRVIAGFTIPGDPTEIDEWYSYAADTAAMYADDDNSHPALLAARELAVARHARVMSRAAEAAGHAMIEQAAAAQGVDITRPTPAPVYVRATSYFDLLLWQHIPCRGVRSWRRDTSPHVCSDCQVIGPWRALYVLEGGA